MKTKTMIASLAVGALFAGCTTPSVTPSSTSTSAEDIFKTVNQAMLQGDIDTALTYSCEGTLPTQEQIEMIRTALDLVPQEMRDQITYEVTEVNALDEHTEIKAMMSLMGQSQEQTALVYHAPSEASDEFCINLTENMDEEPAPENLEMDTGMVPEMEEGLEEGEVNVDYQEETPTPEEMIEEEVMMEEPMMEEMEEEMNEEMNEEMEEEMIEEEMPLE